jgi:putative phosphoesterase
MKIALLGDVHANLYALEAVLEHARDSVVDAIWNIGDFVGYGPFPEEVVKRIKSEGVVSIIGNYDQKVLLFPQKKKKWRKKKHPYKYFAFRWVYENLSKGSRRYLASLPEQRRVEVDGVQVLLTHASPVSNEEPLTPDTPIERLQVLASIAKADVVVFGHSHREFVREVDGVWFVNTGTVGRPDDGDPRACYAIMKIRAGAIEVAHHRLEYDLAATVTAIRERDLPEAFAQMLIQGHDLNTILQDSDIPTGVQTGGGKPVN